MALTVSNQIMTRRQQLTKVALECLPGNLQRPPYLYGRDMRLAAWKWTNSRQSDAVVFSDSAPHVKSMHEGYL